MDDNPEHKNEFSIELGDIIQIISPTNSDLDSHAFYVSYVDSSKIKMINIHTYTVVQLNIDTDGTITDESIREIHLLTRSEDAGFARQNRLLPKTWIDIHFGGEIPYIATGEITNLEEDMIEIKTVENEVFYIDFEYKGLPEDIPIDKIVIRDPPTTHVSTTSLLDEVQPVSSPGEEPSIEYTEEGESIIHIPQGTVPDALIDDVLHEIYLDANELYGQDLEDVFRDVEIPEYQKKYTLETQVNDIMDELLSTIPNSRRTAQVMAKIHNLVERFKELRNMYSIFDENGNVIGKKKYGDTYKPLIDRISSLDTRLRWLIPTVKQTKKLYKAGGDEDDDVEISNNDTDVVVLSMTDEYQQESSLHNNYYKNVSIGNENKYESFYSKLHPYEMPFLPPNSPESLLTFKQEVMMDIDAIVNGYSTTLKKNKMNKFQYMVQRYNLGTYRVSSTEMKNGMKVSVKTPLTPADKISIQSWFMMPHSVVKYSHVDLPASNIMVRSQLSQSQLDLFRIFHNSSKFASKFIGDLNKELEYEGDGDEFIQKITEYILDDTIEDEDKHRKLLNVIIPKTRVLIKYMQKYNSTKLSLVDVVSMLEPFLIYPDNLTYGQYNEIRYHIKQKILEYKGGLSKKSNDLKFVYKRKTDSEDSQFEYNKIRKLINQFDRTDVIGKPEQVFDDHYHFPKSYTTSETLSSILKKDSGALFCNLLTYTLLKLITPNALLDSLEKFEISDSSDDIRMLCAGKVFAKTYKSIDELQKDNSKGVIYWDKDLDKTEYGILTKYSNEKDKMLPEKFVKFLAENLVQKHDCPREFSQELADTIIRGKKIVKDGEHAIVEVEDDKDSSPKYHYYVRKNGQWVQDKDMDSDAVSSDAQGSEASFILCNKNTNCNYDNKMDTCESGKDQVMRMRKMVYSKSLKELDKKMVITIDELKSELEQNILSLSTLLKHKTVLNESILYKENNVAYDIGKYAVKHDMIQSPHLMLRDLILSQSDFIKKQQDISRFVSMFCREPIPDNGEDLHWKYCTQTNVKLFPASLYELSIAFIADDDYNGKLNELCNRVGQLSDDGDAVVDKHSGYVLRKIDFVNEEEYDDAGFKITTHGILEKDIGTIAEEALKKTDREKVFENEMSQLIYNVFHSICGNVGVDPVNHEEFVMRVSTELLSNPKIVFSQSAYDDHIKELEKQTGKVSYPPYNIYRNQILITCVASLTLVSIQSTLENVRPRKTFPGCVYSFGGYPVDGGVENDAGLKYISCVVAKTKSSIVPWNSLQKWTDKIIASRILDFLKKRVVLRNDVNDMIVRKREYMILHPDDTVPNIHNVSNKWKEFLPPLIPFKVSTSLQGTSREFDEETMKLMRDGNKLQDTHYNVYKSKIIQHTYGIVELINENVQSKDVLMKTMSNIPYLENACCNDGDIRLNPIQYFISENKNIDLYIKRSAKCEMYSNRIRGMRDAPYLFNKENNRFVYPDTVGNFYEKEQHIYESIIHYCNFDTEIPIPDDLLVICREKPAGYDKNASLEEKIDFLKKNGKKYTPADLSNMMRIVNGRNIQNLVPEKSILPIRMLQDFLESMRDKNSTVIEEPLRRHLGEVLEKYNPSVMIHEKDVESTPFALATANLRKYLRRVNTEMHKEIMDYIRGYGNLSNAMQSKIEDHILHLFTWEIDNIFQISGFFKNSIYNITKTYPEMLLPNNRSHTFLSEYWDFSKKHMDDIQREIENYREDIQKFKNRKLMGHFMGHVNPWAGDIYKFIQLIPIQSPIVKNGETFYGLFRKDTLHMLYMYCWYSVIHEYIQLSDDDDMAQVNIVHSKNTRREKNTENMDNAREAMSVSYLTSQGDDEEEYNEDIQNIDIDIGDKEELKTSVCEFLLACIRVEQNDKKLIDKKYTDVARAMKRTKEQEKQKIIHLVEDTENNDPKIEKMLKKHKLGRWNVGAQKSLYKYNKEAYDNETTEESMFEQAQQQGLDAEELERMAEEEIDAEHDMEGADISGLGEEYYDGAYYPEDRDQDE